MAIPFRNTTKYSNSKCLLNLTCFHENLKCARIQNKESKKVEGFTVQTGIHDAGCFLGVSRLGQVSKKALMEREGSITDVAERARGIGEAPIYSTNINHGLGNLTIVTKRRETTCQEERSPRELSPD